MTERNEDLMHLHFLGEECRHYELELDFKLKTVKAITQFVFAYLEYLDDHPEDAAEFWVRDNPRPTKILTGSDFARIYDQAAEAFHQISRDVSAEELAELDQLFHIAANMLWIIPFIEDIPLLPMQWRYSPSGAASTYDILLTGCAMNSARPPHLGVRRIEAAGSKYTEVPSERDERAPDRYLEDRITSLKEDIAALRKSLGL
jgi:hypothetical protein